MSDEDGQIVGSISPTEGLGDDPVFEVEPSRRGFKVEPDTCSHLRYKLDEEWSKVTCAKCGEPLEAFDVLLRYSEWEERMKNRQYSMETAERRMLATSLRQMMKRVALKDHEKVKIRQTLDASTRYGSKGYVTTTESLRKLEKEYGDMLRHRKRRKGKGS